MAETADLSEARGDVLLDILEDLGYVHSLHTAHCRRFLLVQCRSPWQESPPLD